jgi:hypothetical protein
MTAFAILSGAPQYFRGHPMPFLIAIGVYIVVWVIVIFFVKK